MATIIWDPKDLPERELIPWAKPPVREFVPTDPEGHPEEADEFNEFIRQLRRQSIDEP